MKPLPEQSIAHYRIMEPIGAGGMGAVYKAYDKKLQRVVALKLLPPEYVSQQDRRRRFFQEARAASALNHPHIHRLRSRRRWRQTIYRDGVYRRRDAAPEDQSACVARRRGAG